jgi:signal transduction histidine kinase
MIFVLYIDKPAAYFTPKLNCMNELSEVNILIVDDREENLLSLESIIEGPYRKIYRAHSGNEALRLNLKVNFDLILSDVQMPEMDGFEMLELLRLDPLKRKIPFIFITAISKEDRFINRGYSGGAVDYLFKPLNVDITQSKVDVFVELARQKKVLQLQNNELENLHEQKNRFIGMLAHDLRNPISGITYYCKFLLEEGQKLTAEQRQIISSVEESGLFMLNMVNDLLDISHIESGNMNLTLEPVNLQVLMNDIVNLNALFAKEKQIVIDLEASTAGVSALLDAHKLRQVLNNLLSNAVKFSHAGTRIEVECACNGQELLFRVKDQGQGIPEEEKEKLFKAFQRTSVMSTAGEKSTGLGLFISARIVEAHGGELKVNSSPGVGSEFYFSLPYRPVQKSAPETVQVEKVHMSGDRTVLVADDDNINKLFLRRLLESLQYRVLVASDGPEVLEKVRNHKVDLIFMDIEMPELDGVEVTRIIKGDQRTNGIKIVGCTGHRDEKELKRCMDAGMESCIHKPITRDNLLTVLDNL